MATAGSMVESGADAFEVRAAAASPTSMNRIINATMQPSTIVRMPKTIRPTERSLYEGNAVASTGGANGFCSFIGWGFIDWIHPIPNRVESFLFQGTPAASGWSAAFTSL